MCRTVWHQTHFHVSYPCYFSLRVKLISSAPIRAYREMTRTSECPHPDSHHSDRLWIWGDCVCALTHSTACKNDLVPITNSVKNSVFNVVKFTWEVKLSVLRGMKRIRWTISSDYVMALVSPEVGSVTANTPTHTLHTNPGQQWV